MYLGQGYKPPKDGVEGLFKLKSNQKKNNAPIFSQIPSASELKTESGLAALENVLKGHPNLSGQHATQSDVTAFQNIPESPSYWKFRSTCQWFHR